jgi:hypothetical protein
VLTLWLGHLYECTCPLAASEWIREASDSGYLAEKNNRDDPEAAINEYVEMRMSVPG